MPDAGLAIELGQQTCSATRATCGRMNVGVSETKTIQTRSRSMLIVWTATPGVKAANKIRPMQRSATALRRAVIAVSMGAEAARG